MSGRKDVEKRPSREPNDVEKRGYVPPAPKPKPPPPKKKQKS